MSFFREQLEAWVAKIDVDTDVVFDVGGAQKPVRGRTKSWAVCEYFIIDLPEPHKEADAAGVVRLEADINYPVIMQRPSLRANVVFCLEVMEYVFDPMTAMRNLRDLLRPTGTLYISFPFVYPHHEPAGKDFLRYTRWGVEKLLKESGFQIEELTPRVTDHADLPGVYGVDGMRASKNYTGHNEVGYMVKATAV